MLQLAVTLYGITRDVDHELAMLTLAFRVGEGVRDRHPDGAGTATYMWLPMLAFEAPLGLWLLVKGVPPPARTMTPSVMASM